MIRFFFNSLSLVAISLIKSYQWTIRPLIGPRCRFFPHCSDYAIESFQKHGPFAGSWLTAKRIGRCHPWCKGGFDPVPDSLATNGARPTTSSQPLQLR